jgi:hypothetical protein
MKLLLAHLFLFGLFGVAAAKDQQASLPPDVQNVMDHFSKTALRANMRFLADDLLEGRGTGTRGQELAAKYVAAQFEAFGLAPGGDKGSWFQNVPFREITVNPAACEVSLTRQGKTTKLKWAEDFLTGGNDLRPDISVEASMIFVGYGVVNPGRQYDDYSNVDAKGKIVVILPGAPASFPANERAHFASTRDKRRQAAAHGAVGVISLWTPDSEASLPWSRMPNQVESSGYRWLDRNGIPNDSFKELRGGAVLSMRAAENLLAGAPQTYAEVIKAAKEGKLRAFPIEGTARLHSVSKHREVGSPNVIGILRGSDPALADEYVVYSAHTDHMGIGKPINGDRIYHGAVDDASGVSALIELARAYSGLSKRPARSFLFLATTAEEQGLLGADYFARFPTVPQRGIVADINMDGASVFYAFKDVIADDHSTLGDTVASVAGSLGLSVSPDPMPEQNGFVRADHYAFVRQGIPALSIGEGLQAKDPAVDGRKFLENWIMTRYHAPSDDMNQPLDFDATVQFMQIAFLTGYHVSEEHQRPAWKKGDFFGQMFGK